MRMRTMKADTMRADADRDRMQPDAWESDVMWEKAKVDMLYWQVR